MSDTPIPSLDELVEMGARAASESKAWPAVFKAGTADEIARAILTAVLPLVLRGPMEALDDLLSSLAENDEEGLIEHAAPMRRARSVRDQIAALIGG